MCVGLIWSFYFLEDRKGALTIAFLDVGQGDAIFIESPTGTQIVIDGGPDASVVQGLSDVMNIADRSLDAIVVTNPDQDHFAGFLPVLSRYRVGAEFEAGTMQDSTTYKAFRALLKEKGVETTLARRGQTIDIGGGAYLRILFPDRDVPDLASNTGSIVMQLVYGKTKVMLMGDTVDEVENYIASLDGMSLKSQILKVGHHGSRTSTGEALLKNVSPEVAVLSLGCDNSYGHPHKEVTERLAKYGVEQLSLCEEGTVIYRSDGESWVRK